MPQLTLSQPCSVFHVAAYILSKQGPMTHMKLQKLVYYCQAWSLVWDETELFSEAIEAWANGPVVPELFRRFKGSYRVTASDLADKSTDCLTPDQQATIDAVLEFYGPHDSQWLSDLTHMERPWKDARSGMATGERGSVPISLAAMADYYSSLVPAQ